MTFEMRIFIKERRNKVSMKNIVFHAKAQKAKNSLKPNSK